VSAIEPRLARYPFLPSAREKLNDFPLDDEIVEMLREPITDQALYRLTSAVRHANSKANIQTVRDFRYDTYDQRTKKAGPNPDVIEFYSYFTAVFASKNDSFLTNALARTEATRAKSLFVNEELTSMIAVLREMVQLKITLSEDKLFATVPVADYLRVSTGYNLIRDERWKLVNLPLKDGIVFLSINALKDMFASLVQGFMLAGMRALKRSPVPDYVKPLVENLKPLVPPVPPTQQGRYKYVERLLEHKITDGRHRVIWLILAPYFVTVKGMDEGAAVEAVLAYIGDTKYRQFIAYNVRRAMRNGMLPPSEQSLRTKHPDILQVLPKEVVRSDFFKKKQR
jgi:hypothetical protein